MTIQRTVLSALATLLLASSASAQSCRLSRRVVIHVPRHHHGPHYVAPRPIYRTAHRVTSHGNVVEAPPTPESIVYGGFTHTDELAARIELLMNEVCLDLYYNYSHNYGFQETYGEAYSLYLTAQFIHAAEHNYDRATVQSRLGGADALLHHIQEDVQGWSRVSHRQIGTLGILTKLEMIEDTLHHLMDDVGVSVTPGLEAPPVPTTLSVPPSPPVHP